jgi:hypothetical protein
MGRPSAAQERAALGVRSTAGDQFRLTDGGGFRGPIGAINDESRALGYVVIGIFVLS